MEWPKKVAIVGSGSFGTTAAKIIAENVGESDGLFAKEVTMWCHDHEDSKVAGETLSTIINNKHENVRYLPGIKLPENVVAEPDLGKAVQDANILVFVLPMQFLEPILPTIKANLAENAIGVSLIKGLKAEGKRIVLVSEMIRKALDIEVSVLMGANVATEMANEGFAEATFGGPKKLFPIFGAIFQRPYFRLAFMEDLIAVELCGVLHNIVAIAAGFCDALGYGNNTKAAIVRIGLAEMGNVVKLRTGNYPIDILIESCGIGDLITTCYGGRHRRCAQAFVETGKSWEAVEKDLLNGQKLQGTLVCQALFPIIHDMKLEQEFPLFINIYNIAFHGAKADSLVTGLSRL